MRWLIFVLAAAMMIFMKPSTVLGQRPSTERKTTTSRNERADRSRDTTPSRERSDRGDTKKKESRQDRDIYGAEGDYDRGRDYDRDDPYDRDDDYDYPRDDGYEYPRSREYRRVKVPPGHLPPPGACRVWYPNRPPGHQPPPVPCYRLRGYRGDGVIVSSRGQEGGYDDYFGDRRYENRGVDDVIFRNDPRSRGDVLGSGTLEDILGDVVFGRIDRHRKTLGAAGPLRGTWVGEKASERVLRLFSGDLRIAELRDRNGDGRPEVISLVSSR